MNAHSQNIPTLLDHIVIGGTDLNALVAWFAIRTGVTAARGGEHPIGTANYLVALTIDGVRGPQYLELIGPNPSEKLDHPPRAFGLDQISGPTVQTYAVRADDIDGVVEAARSRGYDPGDVSDLSRYRPDGVLLEWRLTNSYQTRLDAPFLIDWGAPEQPGLSDIPAIELVSFVRVEPDPEPLRAELAALGLGDGIADVVQGETPGYRLVLRRADGELVEFPPS